ncbi:hypothetical protein STIB_72510 [Streptomyces sp. IB2014 011-1]|nr:hypothetical protein STIB_72510 [Streptomyces sp. IB2014 011-1]
MPIWICTLNRDDSASVSTAPCTPGLWPATTKKPFSAFIVSPLWALTWICLRPSIAGYSAARTIGEIRVASSISRARPSVIAVTSGPYWKM